MDTRKFSIYSVYHKPFLQPGAGFVIPIHAGKAISNTELGFAGDDTGDNISDQNRNFCELTVVYWIWKNVAFEPGDIWGLCHYRRYFGIPATGWFSKKRSFIKRKPTAAELDARVNDRFKDYVCHTLETADAIIQEPAYASKKKGKILTIEAHYLQEHIAEHWKASKEVMLEFYPEYATSLAEFCNSEKMSFANMMIASAAVWDGYLSWLFHILFEVQKRTAIPEDAYQARVFGFISERILTLYLRHNKLRVAYMPIEFYE